MRFASVGMCLVLTLAFSVAMPSGGVSALAGTNTVDGGDIKNGTVTSADIKDQSLMAVDLGPNSVGTSEIKTNGVGNAELVDNIVVNSLTANAIYSSNIFNTDFLNLGDGVVLQIADNGAGTAASLQIDTANAWAYMGLECLDSDGCSVPLGQDFIDGDVMFIYNYGTNPVTFSDASGTSELAGDFTMGQWDTLQLIFQNDGSSNRWLEVSRSNN